MSTVRTSKAACHESWCPIERTLGVIGGVWKVIIIRELLTGTKRYGHLLLTGLPRAETPSWPNP